MDNPLNQVTDWVNSQGSRFFLIRKEEDGDLDEAYLHLDHVALGNLGRNDPDDYVATHAILLHGDGQLKTAFEQVRLPQGVYEIPLAGHWQAEFAGRGLRIQTDRAVYTIEAQLE
ncbi:MAG: hypothetical protein JWN30_1788 [Bacilli bacterium]|nr:hypothetical protein [Bacilli bacterium]